MCMSVHTRRSYAKHPKLGQPSQTGTVGRKWRSLETAQSTEESDIVSLLWTWGQDRPICTSTNSTSVAQVCPCPALRMQVNNHTILQYNVHTCLTIFLTPQMKNKLYKLVEKYAFIRECRAVANTKCLQSQPTVCSNSPRG